MGAISVSRGGGGTQVRVSVPSRAPSRLSRPPPSSPSVFPSPHSGIPTGRLPTSASFIRGAARRLTGSARQGIHPAALPTAPSAPEASLRRDGPPVQEGWGDSVRRSTAGPLRSPDSAPIERGLLPPNAFHDLPIPVAHAPPSGGHSQSNPLGNNWRPLPCPEGCAPRRSSKRPPMRFPNPNAAHLIGTATRIGRAVGHLRPRPPSPTLATAWLLALRRSTPPIQWEEARRLPPNFLMEFCPILSLTHCPHGSRLPCKRAPPLSRAGAPQFPFCAPPSEFRAKPLPFRKCPLWLWSLILPSKGFGEGRNAAMAIGRASPLPRPRERPRELTGRRLVPYTFSTVRKSSPPGNCRPCRSTVANRLPPPPNALARHIMGGTMAR
jgi:hypothetical protein